MATEIPAEELVDIRTLNFGTVSRVDVCLWNFSRAVVKKKLLLGDHIRHKNDLIKEVSILCDIRHENVVSGLGFVHTREEFSVISEYCIYESYHKHFITSNCDTRRLKDEAVKLLPIKLNILRGVASGMAFLHKQPFLHLRLKPENILLNERFEPRIANFGKTAMKKIATLSTLRTSHLRANLDETPSLFYMAPEHLNDPQSKATTKTDVYAFGILAWQVATDLVPYNDIEGIRNVSVLVNFVCCNSKRPREEEIPRVIPLDVVEIIKTCWSQDPELRPEFTSVAEKLEYIIKSQKLGESSTRIALATAKALIACESWASLKSILPDEEGVVQVRYGNFRITVAVTVTIRHTGLGYECEARDAATGINTTIPYHIRARAGCQRAVACLIRIMAAKGIYLRPTDEDRMNLDTL